MYKLLFLFLPLLLCSNIFAVNELIGKEAPTFAMKNNNGKGRIVLKNSFEEKKAVILSFAATWCVPCKKELPYIQSVLDSLKSDNIEMIVILQDKKFKSKQKKFIKKLKVKAPVLCDSFGIVSKRYGATKELPFTVFIDKNGVVQDVSKGFTNKKKSEIKKKIHKLIK